MRRSSLAAVLLAAAAVVSAGESAVELVYEFGEGEAAAAAKVLARRLELLAVEGVGAKALEDGKRVAIRVAARGRLDEIRAMATRVGRLELRRVVDSEEPAYEKRREAFEDALADGTEPEKAREVPAASLAAKERERWPQGLRWYRNPKPSDTLREEWVLCEVDAHGLSEDALADVTVSLAPQRFGDDAWVVLFAVKEAFRDAMERLTSAGEHGQTRLAVVVDGEILFAPRLYAALRERGQITLPDESESSVRAFAAAMGGGRLPCKPELVEERAVDR